jgi:ABC-type nitrate/sulfonate/bicarbonate transport system substrate-binding protein
MDSRLSRRRFVSLAAATAGALGLAACRGPEASPSPGPNPGSPGGQAQPTAGGLAVQPRKLRFGFSGIFDITKLPYPVALARLREQGFEIEPIFMDSAPVTFAVLIARELDAAEGAVASAIQANVASGGTNLRVFVSMNPLTDYVLVTTPEITALPQLLGKRFGVARLGSISHFVPRVVLQRSGLDPNAVEWIAVGGTAQRRAALYSGAIVGGVMHIEEALLARRDGYNILVEAAPYMPEYIANGLVAPDALVRQDPALIQHLTNTMIDAARWTMDNRDAALAFAANQSGGDADPAVLSEAYDSMVRIRGWGVNGGLTPENMTATMTEELEMSTIDRPAPWEEWATMDFVNRYLADRGPYG